MSSEIHCVVRELLYVPNRVTFRSHGLYEPGNAALGLCTNYYRNWKQYLKFGSHTQIRINSFKIVKRMSVDDSFKL